VNILSIFVALRFVQYFFEKYLSRLNFDFVHDKENQSKAQKELGLTDEDMHNSLAYFKDRFQFGSFSNWLKLLSFMVFLVLGGFGLLESLAKSSVWDAQSGVQVGLVFFAYLGLISLLFSLPFRYYSTFVIEDKHGFNKQNPKGFVMDTLKSMGLAMILGGVLVGIILYIMDHLGEWWWLWAWAAMTGFSVFTSWAYPTLIAPLFNKFSKLEDGELSTSIQQLADKVGFASDGVFVMDASTRSSHGNAYFTGVFGKKRIVLFDTLVSSMSPNQVIAVLAHELGHFKLHHVRGMLIRSTIMTGVVLYILSLCLPLEAFYRAFHFDGVSSYGALVVFGMWFGLVDAVLSPIESFLSRKNEFAADAFACANIDQPKDLRSALLVLREKSKSLPMAHPWYSAYYYSHPPILERLEAMPE
jgi:STE24 endopeptidase